MSDSKVVSLRIPDEIYLKLEALAEYKYPLKGKPGGNKSQVLLDALITYLHDVNSVNTVDKPVNTVDNIRETVNTVDIHSLITESIAPLQQQIDSLKAELGEFAA